MLFNVTVQRENGILETYKNVDGRKRKDLADLNVKNGTAIGSPRFAGFPIVSVEKVPQEQINAELSYFNKYGTECE